jgi:hypothetical protein
MSVALWLLATAAIALGVFPDWVIDHIASPAASSLLHAGIYSHAVLAGAARIPRFHVALNYFDPQELITVAISIALGLTLARDLCARQRTWADHAAASHP